MSSPIESAELTRKLWRTVVLIREFETVAGRAFSKGEIPGFIHLSIGQEGVAAGVCAALDDRDKLTSTHRGHGHCLARGADPARMMAEIYAKESGLGRGRGGTMHLYDLERGILGTNGIVAAGGPLACGAALAERTAGSGAVVVCFMGDGATDNGATHEAMNLAGVWSLPVIFVVENNGFSEGTPLARHTAATQLVDRAAAYSMPGVRVDGQDAVAVYEVTLEAVRRAREGEGPTLIEAVTSRSRGHFEGDGMKYVLEGPDAEAATRDPIDVLRAQIEGAALLDAASLDAIQLEVSSVVAEARQSALDGARPRAEDLLSYVWATPILEGAR